ncbi:NAD(P)H-dependent oxidoreductase subunit E [Dehalococcoidia bacterium]|nr:NAD(P)H-dependent oxidoreductase subunit E [Dehalococcoidia bacterium]
MEDLSTEEKEALDRILASHKRERAKLIPILQDVQVQLGYLPEQAMLEIAEYLQIDGSAVYGIATFYNQFRLTPPGKHPVKICMGTACHMKGGDICSRSLGKGAQYQGRGDYSRRRV